MPIAREKNNITRRGGRTWAGDAAGGTPAARSRKASTVGETAAAGPAQQRTRGYIKLSSAARAFDFDFRGKIILDIGSSTGGFTQCALDHGAKKVIAIEKGTNQMVSPLRFDSRVDLHEKTDIFDFKLKNVIDTVVADVSFISLKPILKYISFLKNAEYIVMLKPQFEAKPNQLINGVVKNETTRREIIKNFEHWLKQNNFLIIKKHDNELKGKTGNKERFYYLKLAK